MTDDSMQKCMQNNAILVRQAMEHRINVLLTSKIAIFRVGLPNLA